MNHVFRKSNTWKLQDLWVHSFIYSFIQAKRDPSLQSDHLKRSDWSRLQPLLDVGIRVNLLLMSLELWQLCEQIRVDSEQIRSVLSDEEVHEGQRVSDEVSGSGGLEELGEEAEVLLEGRKEHVLEQGVDVSVGESHLGHEVGTGLGLVVLELIGKGVHLGLFPGGLSVDFEFTGQETSDGMGLGKDFSVDFEKRELAEWGGWKWDV